MKKKILAGKALKARIAAVRANAGLKSFLYIPNERIKVENIPCVSMFFGVDKIIKRSSRTASPSRLDSKNIRSAEIILEIVTNNSVQIEDIYKKVWDAVFIDIYPLTLENGNVDTSVYIEEERTEGPVGYGLPDTQAVLFVFNLIYPE